MEWHYCKQIIYYNRMQGEGARLGLTINDSVYIGQVETILS
jgi:hypothetical protein